MAVKSIRDLEIGGRRVFFRFDFNVPLDETGTIKDDTRIQRALPTLRYAMEQGARCILSSHLGRPKGEKRPEMSLRPVALRLGDLLGREVRFADDCVGTKAEDASHALGDGELLLLENLRFHPGETKNEPEFAQKLARLADVYVNDAFGTAHRAHASTVGVPGLVSAKGAGLLLKEELDSLTKAFSNPEKPVTAIFGGAKVSDKLGVLTNILERMDSVLIGGGMANTFLAADGLDMGISRVEVDMLDTARDIVRSASEKGCSLYLPVDVVSAPAMEHGAECKTVAVEAVPTGEMALDIGRRTAAEFTGVIARAGTIVWNGPMGVFELEDFKAGTMAIARAVASAPGFSVVGGGDTVRAIHQAGVTENISYISTGGGAFMEFMEGKTLPGVAALEE
ncbi:MAG: phosphoglycerate kinase [Desulfomonilaceae bacterium]|nr:phosphoglycerate kinase [Desulfomonilaceae bacterium]